MTKPRYIHARLKCLQIVLMIFACTFMGAGPALAQLADEKAPVDLQADKLTHDEHTQIITASGNVILKQAGRTLEAEEVQYNLREDTVVATGNVVLTEANGDVHHADNVQFNNQLKNGFVKSLQTYLVDGSRFTAEEGERTDGVTTVMHDATYTPCEACKENPDKAPLWQIRSNTVTHDEVEKQISYRDATFEIYGVPVAYVPYFSHPDGTEKQKSGFLSPNAGYKSDLGGFAGSEYYWAIAEDRDATVGMTVMTSQAPLMTGEYRQRWENARLQVEGGVTYSSRPSQRQGQDFTKGEEARGHIFAEGLWDIDDKWRAGTNIAAATDDQYMRQYDFTNEYILENEVFAERFSGRNYTVGRLLAFQDIRVREIPIDQPNVLPEIITSFLGEPGSVPVVGGRWSLDGSLLGLQRSGDDQDMGRASVTAGWQRKFVSDMGLLTTVNATVRGDLYHTRDREIATTGSGLDSNVTDTRLFPQLHIQASYPVASDFEKFQAVVEPIVAVTAAPNIDASAFDIPNEDSQDVQIDASNLFEPNRFPGLDRVEDQSRVTYGVRTGLYGHGGSRGDIFVGQSYRLNEDDNPFPVGSGLDRQESDIVGQLSAEYAGRYAFDYRFQLASHDLTSQRHEVDGSMNLGRTLFSTQYLFAKGLDGTDIDESREQISNSLGYYFTPEWRGRLASTYDLGANPGLRRGTVGLDYFGQCLSWSVDGQRNLTDTLTGESNTEIIFRIGLKNLGEFQESGLRKRTAE